MSSDPTGQRAPGAPATVMIVLFLCVGSLALTLRLSGGGVLSLATSCHWWCCMPTLVMKTVRPAGLRRHELQMPRPHAHTSAHAMRGQTLRA